MSNKKRNPLITIRDPESFSNELRLLLDVITFNEIPNVVGSYAYTNHRYPSDVDVFDMVQFMGTSKEAKTFYPTQFKIMIERLIVMYPTVLISDFKAGYDIRFRNIYYNNNLDMKDIKTLEELDQILPRDKLIELYQSKNNIQFKENLRDYMLLRWSPEEILLEKKILPSKVGIHYISLSDAVTQDAVVKLDTITWVKDRYQSVEVFYSLGYHENSELKLFYPLGNYVESLKSDVEKYSSREYYAPMKVAKRLWSLSRITDCTEVLNSLNPLMQSDAAALNQIRSEIEMLTSMINIKEYQFIQITVLNQDSHLFLENKNMDKIHTLRGIFLQSLNFSKRLTNHLEYKMYEPMVGIFDKIFELFGIYKAYNILHKEELINNLNKIKDYISKEVIRLSESYLREIEEVGMTCKQINLDISKLI